MLGLAWYAGTLASAFVFLLNNVYPRMTLVECALAAVPVGTIGGAWLALLMSTSFGSISSGPMMATVVVLGLYTAFAMPTFLKRLPVAVRGITGAGGRAPERASAIWTGALVAAATALFYPLWDSHMLFQKEDGSVWTGGSCWADFPIHMHITQSMLHGRNSAISLAGMQSPIFADRPLTYPYLPDFHAAVMVWFGSTLRQVYFATGFLSLLSLVGLVFSLGARMTSSRTAAALGVAVLICLGGVGGLNILLKHGWDFALTKDPIQADLAPGGSDVSDGVVFWFGFLPHVFLPQRGATLAYPAVAAAALLLWQAVRPSRSPAAPGMPLPERRFLLILCAAVCALLPLVQAHSFAAMAVFVAVVFLLDAHSWTADAAAVTHAWLPAGGVAVALFLPQWLVFGRMVDGKSHFLELLPVFSGHGASAPEALKAVLGRDGLLLDFVWCWVRAMGPFLPLFLLALVAYAVPVALGAAEAVRSVVSPDAAPGPRRDALDAASRRACDHMYPLDVHDGVLAHAAEAGVGAFGSSAAPGTGPARLAASKKDDDARGPAPAGARTGFEDEDGAELHGPRGGWESMPGETGPMDPDQPFGFFARHPLPRCYGVPPGFESMLVTTADESAPPAAEADPAAAARARNALAAEADPVGAALSRVAAVTGAAQPLVAGMDSVSPLHRRLSAVKFACAAWAVFLLGCFVKFQPWDRDNTKILYVFAIVAAPFVGQVLLWPVTAGLAALAAPTEARVPGAAPRSDDAPDAIGRVDTHTAETKQSGLFLGRFGGILLLLIGAPLAAAVLAAGATSGVLSIVREFGMFHELYGPLEVEVGDFMREHVPAKSVVLTDNTHRSPAGYWAGRPSLAGYDGWLWSHGYDYGERHSDRNFIMQHVNDVNGREAYDKMRRWGVRYVLAEHKGQPEGAGDGHDLFLDGNTKRIFSSGRYQVFEVLGYEFPPS